MALLGLLLVAIGVAAMVAPGFAAASYGVDATFSAHAFVRAAGARDVAIGALLLVLLARRVDTTTLGIVVLVTTLVPIVDSVIVLQASGLRLAVVIHAGSILPILILAMTLIGVRDAPEGKTSITNGVLK